MTSGEISAAVTDLGWRFALGTVRTSVPVASLAAAVDAAGEVSAVAGADADAHVRFDARADRLLVSVQTRAIGWITPSDVDLVRRITAALRERGLATDPGVGAGPAGRRAEQVLEIAIDALDIPAVRPFWKAVLGYVDELPTTGPTGPLVDPYGQGPAVWFQQMDAPRPQRNRIHIDVSVPHDEAPARIAATLAAGGTLVSDEEAPAFWVLADAEGNEACVTTWQGRD
jgi:4a-hydroxytetrahydrobiopterin dehydratase